MGLDLRQYMGYTNSDEEKDFFELWEDAFVTLGAQEVLFCTSDYWGYGGSIDIDILLSDGRVLSYSYAFDSCCDRLEGTDAGSDIEDDIKESATYFDNLAQYDAWVDTLPKEDDLDGDNNVRKNQKEKRRNKSLVMGG